MRKTCESSSSEKRGADVVMLTPVSLNVECKTAAQPIRARVTVVESRSGPSPAATHEYEGPARDLQINRALPLRGCEQVLKPGVVGVLGSDLSM